MEEALRAMEARLTAAEQQIADRTAELTEARRVIDQMSTAGPAAAGAAAAPQQPSRGESSLVDTRALGKPPLFSGDLTADGKPEGGLAWPQWSFTFRAYAGAFDPTCRDALEYAANKVDDEQQISNVMMDVNDKKLSSQIYYVLAL
eukprot:1241371-Pyramimonas_sp.AAC.1